MLIGVHGKPSSGKSLGTTFLACALADLSGYPIYANYYINYPRAFLLQSRGQLINLEKAIIVLDEAHDLVDSRSWKDTKQIKLTHWIMKLRHKGLICFVISQHIRQIDIRLRWILDILIFCQRISPKPAEVFKFTFVDWWYGTIGRSLVLEKPERFYYLYDSFGDFKPLD